MAVSWKIEPASFLHIDASRFGAIPFIDKKEKLPLSGSAVLITELLPHRHIIALKVPVQYSCILSDEIVDWEQSFR